MTTTPQAMLSDLDVCECGDYRRNHDAKGACKFNRPKNVGHFGAPDCFKFRLAKLDKAKP